MHDGLNAEAFQPEEGKNHKYFLHNYICRLSSPDKKSAFIKSSQFLFI